MRVFSVGTNMISGHSSESWALLAVFVLPDRCAYTNEMYPCPFLFRDIFIPTIYVYIFAIRFCNPYPFLLAYIYQQCICIYINKQERVGIRFGRICKRSGEKKNVSYRAIVAAIALPAFPRKASCRRRALYIPHAMILDLFRMSILF